MAANCYQRFKDIYNQAIADGLATAVAQLAAQSAYDDCLRNQSLLQQTAVPTVSVSASRIPDPGPQANSVERLGDK